MFIISEKEKNIIHFNELTQILIIAYRNKYLHFDFYSTPCANIMTIPGSATKIHTDNLLNKLLILTYSSVDPYVDCHIPVLQLLVYQ